MSESEEIVGGPAAPDEDQSALQQPEAGVVAYWEKFSGPLPAPTVLEGYESICPGAADRIISLAERQSAHRQALEARVVESNCRAQDRGPLFGFALGTMVIVIGGILLWNDKDLAGLTALIAALAAIVVPFVLSKRRQRSELESSRSRDQDAAQGSPAEDRSTPKGA